MAVRVIDEGGEQVQYTSVGRSGLQVSRVCLGTMNFGFVTDETTSFEIMDEAVEAGINFIDTADVYGGPQSDMEQGYGMRWRPQLEPYEALCQELGEGPAEVALAWLLQNPAVTAPIIGPRTVAQLRGNLSALNISLSDDALRRLDEIWPGPGGEAPKAYAW